MCLYYFTYTIIDTKTTTFSLRFRSHDFFVSHTRLRFSHFWSTNRRLIRPFKLCYTHLLEPVFRLPARAFQLVMAGGMRTTVDDATRRDALFPIFRYLQVLPGKKPDAVLILMRTKVRLRQRTDNLISGQDYFVGVDGWCVSNPSEVGFEGKACNNLRYEQGYFWNYFNKTHALFIRHSKINFWYQDLCH